MAPARAAATVWPAASAAEVERWLDKPVLQINATTYRHALRINSIADKVYGYGSLLARF